MFDIVGAPAKQQTSDYLCLFLVFIPSIHPSGRAPPLGFLSSVQQSSSSLFLHPQTVCYWNKALPMGVWSGLRKFSAATQRTARTGGAAAEFFRGDFVWTLHRPFQVPKPQDLERSSSVFSWRQSSMHWTSYHRGGSISLSSSHYYRLMSKGLWYTRAWWCAIKCLLVCIYYCVHMAPDWCFGE